MVIKLTLKLVSYAIVFILGFIGGVRLTRWYHSLSVDDGGHDEFGETSADEAD